MTTGGHTCVTGGETLTNSFQTPAETKQAKHGEEVHKRVPTVFTKIRLRRTSATT